MGAIRLYAAFIALSVVLFEPCLGAETWDCEFVQALGHQTNNANSTLTLPAKYRLENGKVRMVNGAVTYRLLVDADFGFTAINAYVCDYCMDGPYIVTDMLTINRKTGAMALDHFFFGSSWRESSEDKGECTKGKE